MNFRGVYTSAFYLLKKMNYITLSINFIGFEGIWQTETRYLKQLGNVDQNFFFLVQ
jgi:hypothetical protein